VAFTDVGSEFPRLGAQLARLHGEDLRAGASRVVEGALERNGLSLPSRDPATVERLVWSLEDQAWKLQEEAAQGTATQVAYNQAFRQARAANGLFELLEGRYGRAVYEATHALYADEDTALELLNGATGATA
jgi:hypothetical protein